MNDLDAESHDKDISSVCDSCGKEHNEDTYFRNPLIILNKPSYVCPHCGISKEKNFAWLTWIFMFFTIAGLALVYYLKVLKNTGTN